MVKALGLTIVAISMMLLTTCGQAIAFDMKPPPPPPEGYPGFDPEEFEIWGSVVPLHFIFEDGFETGDTEMWSSGVP